MALKENAGWFRLDNAGLIFPAALRRNWSNAYRISITLKEKVEPELLQTALYRIQKRFSTMMVALKPGFFWFYLEAIKHPPKVRKDGPRPLAYMSRHELSKAAFRVLYYEKRIAVEFFHAVTDGTGALVFAKTLAAEYLRLKEGISLLVPPGASVNDPEGVLNLQDAPFEAEAEDSFVKYAGPVSAKRDSANVYHLKGTWEMDRSLHVTLGKIDAQKLSTLAREKGVTVTAFLTAVLLKALLEIQQESGRPIRRQKPVKVQIPVNLRSLFPSRTLRNFVAVMNIGVDPKTGEYSFEELLRLVHHQMKLLYTDKQLRAVFTPNVRSAQNPLIKGIPLIIKNWIMRLVFDTIGETVAAFCLSNLGDIKLPAAMEPYVDRVEFILGPQAKSPYNVSLTSWQGTAFLNVSRSCRESYLEQKVFPFLVELGLEVEIEAI